MRRRSFLAGTVTATAGLAGCGALSGRTDETTSDGPERLRVEDNWLVDSDETPVTLRGVNVVDPWWGTTYAKTHGKGYWETIELATDGDRGWDTDVLRVPIQPATVEQVGLETLTEDYLDRVVEMTRERDVYVIVDYHAIERYDTERIDTRLRAFWNHVAPRYAEASHVFYEVFNEPTRPAGNGRESWRTWRETAQPWVDLVRDHAPKTPIIVGSPEWSSMVRFAPEDPFQGDNLLYTAHVFPSWDASTWESHFGDPALEVPVFLDEWGYIGLKRENVDPHMVGSTDGWGRPFRDWLASHPNVNWSAWSFSAEWMPVMFDHQWNLLGGDDYMGAFVKQWLADASGRPANDRTITENSPPEPPTVHVGSRSSTTATLGWTGVTDPDGDPIAQYRVTVDGGEPALVRGTKRSVEITGLSPGETYEVRIVAVDPMGATSDPATATVSTPSREEPVLSMPRAPAKPTVDGDVDDVWSSLPEHSVGQWLWGENAADVRASWRGCWDDRGLYVLVDVTDGDSVTALDEEYRNDVVEIYLDLDNSRTNNYDGEDDFQLLYPRGSQRVIPGANSATNVEPIRVTTTETDGGWRVETAIPWEPYGVTPETGTTFGFDVHVSDNEDGNEREGKRAWYARSDVSWQTPQAFAVVELGGAG
ncbi:MAG: sugar-binding protein [Halorhabdus sp.]